MQTKTNCDCVALRAENERLIEERRLDEASELAEWQRQCDERKRLAAEALHKARDWPEAFRNEDTLIRQELAFDAGDGVDGFFSNALAANARATVLYHEKMAALETLRRKLLDEISAQIEEEFYGKVGVTDLIRYLRVDDPAGYVNW